MNYDTNFTAPLDSYCISFTTSVSVENQITTRSHITPQGKLSDKLPLKRDINQIFLNMYLRLKI